MDQRVVTLAGLHDDVAAASAIAARWTSAGHKFFPAKGHATVAAVAGLHPNDCFINKHACYLIVQSREKIPLESRGLRTGPGTAQAQQTPPLISWPLRPFCAASPPATHPRYGRRPSTCVRMDLR